MKFFMISKGGDGLGLLLRLKMEGHETACWIRDRRSKQNYDGILLKKERWEEWIDENTIIIFDTTGGGRIADRLRASGHLVLCGSSFADQLEIDRAVAKQIVEGTGVRCPREETFTDWKKAKDYVRERKVRMAFKPSHGMKDVMSFLASDWEEMVEMLDYFRKRTKSEVEFELQDFVRGVEVSTEGWFNGQEFMTPFNHTLERKQLMNDNLGPSGGCAGNVVWHLKETDRVVEEGLKKMQDILAYNSYIGPWDFNTIVNEEGVWWLENTPRFGYDALPAWLETLDQPLGELFNSLAREEHPTHLITKEGFGAALRVSVPPYPSEHDDWGELPVRGFTSQDRKHLFFYDVKLDEKAQVITTADSGATVALTGWGETIADAMGGPEWMARKALIPNKQFRTDLTGLFLEEYYKLQQELESRNGKGNEVLARPVGQLGH